MIYTQAEFSSLKHIPNDLVLNITKLLLSGREAVTKKVSAHSRLPNPTSLPHTMPGSGQCLNISCQEGEDYRTTHSFQPEHSANQSQTKEQENTARKFQTPPGSILSIPCSLVQICFAALKRHLGRRIGSSGKVQV